MNVLHDKVEPHQLLWGDKYVGIGKGISGPSEISGTTVEDILESLLTVDDLRTTASFSVDSSELIVVNSNENVDQRLTDRTIPVQTSRTILSATSLEAATPLSYKGEERSLVDLDTKYMLTFDGPVHIRPGECIRAELTPGLHFCDVFAPFVAGALRQDLNDPRLHYVGRLYVPLATKELNVSRIQIEGSDGTATYRIAKSFDE